MSTRDDDILDFDFSDEEDRTSWEEPEGFEPQPPGAERGRKGGRGSGFRPPRNLTPLLRLIGLIALAILVVVLLAVWVEGCAADAKLDRNRTYLADIGSIGNASAKLGQQLGTLLTTPGLNEEDLDAKLGGYVQTAENQMQQAEDLNAPGPMVVPNAGAVEALRYRVNGLRGLQAAFKEAADETDASVAGEQLLAQTRRLLASDIIWSDSFQEPAQVVLTDEGIEGLDVPVLRVRHHRRPRKPELARRDLAADSGRVDGRDADRSPRQRNRVRQGAPERAAPLDDDGDDHQGDGRVEVRGGRGGHG